MSSLALPTRSIDLRGAATRLSDLQRDQANFLRLAVKLKSLTGIHLTATPKNQSLMASRLIRIIEAHGMTGYEAYIGFLKSSGKAAEQEFVSALTTNTTEFFREAKHYEVLTRLLPDYLRAKRASGGGELRIWCAAASSGQEVYSMAMTLLEADPSLSEMNLKILASDIDQDILAKASRGAYTVAECAGVPPIFKQKYFRKGTSGGQDRFEIRDSIRKLVTFAPFNLMTEVYPFQQGFDIIFCRNVLIYFERNVATAVTDRMGAVLKPGGYLFLGHSEAGIANPNSFDLIGGAVYRKAKATP